jgi:hypothetical protein
MAWIEHASRSPVPPAGFQQNTAYPRSFPLFRRARESNGEKLSITSLSLVPIGRTSGVFNKNSRDSTPYLGRDSASRIVRPPSLGGPDTMSGRSGGRRFRSSPVQGFPGDLEATRIEPKVHDGIRPPRQNLWAGGNAIRPTFPGLFSGFRRRWRPPSLVAEFEARK